MTRRSGSDETGEDTRSQDEAAHGEATEPRRALFPRSSKASGSWQQARPTTRCPTMRWLPLLLLVGCASAYPSSYIDEIWIYDDPKVLPIELPEMRPPDPAQSIGGYEVRDLPIDGRNLHATNSLVVAIAVTDDGRAAVTVDSFGGTRVWPTLDGNPEPAVVSPQRPAVVDIVRVRDRLIVVGLDGAGELEIIHTNARG